MGGWPRPHCGSIDRFAHQHADGGGRGLTRLLALLSYPSWLSPDEPPATLRELLTLAWLLLRT